MATVDQARKAIKSLARLRDNMESQVEQDISDLYHDENHVNDWRRDYDPALLRALRNATRYHRAVRAIEWLEKRITVAALGSPVPW